MYVCLLDKEVYLENFHVVLHCLKGCSFKPFFFFLLFFFFFCVFFWKIKFTELLSLCPMYFELKYIGYCCPPSTPPQCRPLVRRDRRGTKQIGHPQIDVFLCVCAAYVTGTRGDFQPIQAVKRSVRK